MNSGDAQWLFISAVPLLSRSLAAADTVCAIRIRPVVTERESNNINVKKGEVIPLQAR